MGFISRKKATSRTPQIVTLIIDDSGSMKDNNKASQATAAVQDLVITLQVGTQGASGWRFLLNIGKFDDQITELAAAVPPLEVNLNLLVFTGERGRRTEMAIALEWGATVIQRALYRCRQVPGYDEVNAPNPLCVFFSDGENTGPDVTSAAQALKSIPFQGGNIDVIACGIGMKPEHFWVMQKIASQTSLALNIDTEDLASFIAEVGATAVEGRSAVQLAERGRNL